jgi:DNA replication protein DnaC
MSTESLADIISRINAKVASVDADPANKAALAADKDGDERRAWQNREAVMQSWGVPTLHLQVLRKADQTAAIRQVEAWLNSSSVFLTFAGGVGVGKSVGAAYWLAIAARGIEPASGFQQRWWKAVDIARMGMYDAKLDAMANCQTLVIDDVGIEYADSKGAFLTTFGDLIDKRYEHQRRTLLTTNLTGANFKERYGERIYDRLCQVGVWAPIVGKSMRASVL